MLYHLIKIIESRYEHAILGVPESKTKFGTRYISVALGGIKEEGAPLPMKACSKEIAENNFPDYFWKALPPVIGGTLVWRMYPKVVQEGDDWSIWARAVVEVH